MTYIYVFVNPYSKGSSASAFAFFEPDMGAFLRAGHAKTGLSAPIPRNCSAIPAVFPLQSLARKKGLVQNRRLDTRNKAPESKRRCPGCPLSNSTYQNFILKWGVQSKNGQFVGPSWIAGVYAITIRPFFSVISPFFAAIQVLMMQKTPSKGSAG